MTTFGRAKPVHRDSCIVNRNTAFSWRAFSCGFLLSLCITSLAQAGTFPSLPGADPLALARAHHYTKTLQYDKALAELSRIAETTDFNPQVLELMSRLIGAVKLDEREIQRKTEENDRGRVALAVTHVGVPLGEEAYSEGPVQKVTQNTVYTYKGLSGRPRDAKDKTFSEYVRIEQQSGDYRLDGTIHYQYMNGPGETDRIRHLNYRIDGPPGTFNVGDSSVHFSRYVLNGVDYRGLGAIIDSEWSELELILGVTPFYKNKDGDDKYIYPRDIVGTRIELWPHGRWTVGQSAAYLRDSAGRVTALDPFNGPRENVVLGIDNDIDIVPGLWDLYHESVYARLDPDILSDVEKRSDSAHYVTTKISLKDVDFVNTLEYVGPDFESGGGFSSFQTLEGNDSFLRQNAISNDRFHYETSLSYAPYDWLYSNVQWSRTRNKLDETQNIFSDSRTAYRRDTTPEHTREDWFQSNIRVDLPWGLPRLGARLAEIDIFSSPGSVDRSNDSTTRQLDFTLSKTVSGVSLDARYEGEDFEDETSGFNDEMRHRLSFTGSSFVWNQLGLISGYSYLRRDRTRPNNDTQRRLEDHEFNLGLSRTLPWGASASLSYAYDVWEDWDATPGSKDTHRLVGTLSWPWTGILMGAHEVTIDPYLSYYKDLSTDPGSDRGAWSTKLEASCKILPEAVLTLSADYRNDDINGDAINGTGEEIRFLLSLRSEFDFTPAPELEDYSYRGDWDSYDAVGP